MKVVYMGRKPASSKGLEYLIKKGVDVAVVVCPKKSKNVHWSQRLVDTAQHYNIPTATDDQLYNWLDRGGCQNLDSP